MTDAVRSQPLVRDLIVSLFGLYGRGSEPLPISQIIALIGTAGPDEQSVRSSVSRMKSRGLLDAAAPGHYLLAGRRAAAFEAGDSRIFGDHPYDPSAAWSLAVFSVPESQRARRVLLKKTLGEMGFGVVGASVYIAPSGIGEEARARLARLELDGYVEWFDLHAPSVERLRTEAAQWWDLDAVADEYRGFLAEFAPVRDRWDATPGADAEAFADHLRLVTAWRDLPYRDPGLPAEALPADWPGAHARELFLYLRGALAGPAARFAGHPDLERRP
ncbi:PaaX family transcriptional regulator [Tsukamurella spumae]|uniref:PaaX family transcriptional regulator n=1 Tax=Tsukamurella spumae TaxID=44753 RepID=A0A846WZU4_9ACTN|nr:PaaX family transcriptional regulator C-terminal domain-containing protein [Tsukamurella spumae]NKY18787.1 PaaX family transcriptional regulator [Tsukamurella spumae]